MDPKPSGGARNVIVAARCLRDHRSAPDPVPVPRPAIDPGDDPVTIEPSKPDVLDRRRRRVADASKLGASSDDDVGERDRDGRATASASASAPESVFEPRRSSTSTSMTSSSLSTAPVGTLVGTLADVGVSSSGYWVSVSSEWRGEEVSRRSRRSRPSSPEAPSPDGDRSDATAANASAASRAARRAPRGRGRASTVTETAREATRARGVGSARGWGAERVARFSRMARRPAAADAVAVAARSAWSGLRAPKASARSAARYFSRSSRRSESYAGSSESLSRVASEESRSRLRRARAMPPRGRYSPLAEDRR